MRFISYLLHAYVLGFPIGGFEIEGLICHTLPFLSRKEKQKPTCFITYLLSKCNNRKCRSKKDIHSGSQHPEITKLVNKITTPAKEMNRIKKFFLKKANVYYKYLIPERIPSLQSCL